MDYSFVISEVRDTKPGSAGHGKSLFPTCCQTLSIRDLEVSVVLKVSWLEMPVPYWYGVTGYKLNPFDSILSLPA